MYKVKLLIALVITLAVPNLLMAGVVWDEAIDGSLSRDRQTPTDFGSLSVGSNDAIGTTVSGISKFFKFNIGANEELSALIVESWDSADDLGFLGIVTGDTFTVDPANPDVTHLLGYVHYGELDLGQDILPNMGQGPWSQGFTPPLGPGDYSFWVRQGGIDPSTWDLNFVVTSPIPEPTTGVLLLGGIVALVTCWRCKRIAA